MLRRVCLLGLGEVLVLGELTVSEARIKPGASERHPFRHCTAHDDPRRRP